jgi:hypothetical protein
MGKGVHTNGGWGMTDVAGFIAQQPGYQPRHAAEENPSGLTYGDPGEHGVRDRGYGPRQWFFAVSFAWLRRLEDHAGTLANLDDVMRAHARDSHDETAVSVDLSEVAVLDVPAPRVPPESQLEETVEMRAILD